MARRADTYVSKELISKTFTKMAFLFMIFFCPSPNSHGTHRFDGTYTPARPYAWCRNNKIDTDEQIPEPRGENAPKRYRESMYFFFQLFILQGIRRARRHRGTCRDPGFEITTYYTCVCVPFAILSDHGTYILRKKNPLEE